MESIALLESLLGSDHGSSALKEKVEEALHSLKSEARKKDFMIRQLQENKTITENFLNKTVQTLEEKNKELLALAKERKKDNEQLLSINKELEQFAYIISHDLQEPLRTILDFTQLLERKKAELLDEKAQTYLTFIAQSSHRMSGLIHAILDYSRIGKSGTKSLINCNGLVNQVLHDLQSVIEEKEARIHLDQLPSIWGFEHEIRSLFQNFISNALKYSKAEQVPDIQIRCQSENGNWHFIIQDNGIGFDPKFSERIFVIFQRLHNPGLQQGSGIGLSQCKKIVELHEGHIWAHSRPNHGSAFHFTLPKLKPDEIL